MRPDPIRDQGLADLGVNERLQRISHTPHGAVRPLEERVHLLTEYKAELKRLRNRVALECHPDRTADLPESERAARSERMIRINRAVDYVMKLRPSPGVQQRRHVVGVVITWQQSPSGWSGTTAFVNTGWTKSPG